jgi:hypothetical protein
VVPHVGLGDYRGIFVFRRQQALIISVPPADYARYLTCFASLTSTSFDDVAALIALIPTTLSRVIGPAWIGYGDAGTLQSYQCGTARLLTRKGDHFKAGAESFG